ncbi:GNAT family N-acetyltransferase [Streptomyces pilosus]|uniref:GNAT family N-acetyltransferase n=1 Tax=Streptomyces pilosus TaxID=28893 RepID=UPI00362512F7
MGFALRPASCGVGYGLETAKLLLDVGFDDLGRHRVWGARSPFDTAFARTVEEAAGMVEEGTIRKHVLKAGKWRDSVVHAILDREWHGPLSNCAAGGLCVRWCRGIRTDAIGLILAVTVASL